MQNQNENSNNKWLISSIIFLILIILVIFGYALSKEIKKKKQVEGEIENLRRQAEKIEKENMQLGERIKYLESEDYQKIEAKDKLNLQSPGEKVVILAQGPVPEKEASPEEPPRPEIEEDKTSNYIKWWNYFFK